MKFLLIGVKNFKRENDLLNESLSNLDLQGWKVQESQGGQSQ